MPNWVYTSMTVSGDEAEVSAFIEKASKPYQTYYKGGFVDGKYEADTVIESTHEGAIQFWNFIEPENKDSYFGDAHGTRPEGYAEWSMEDKLAYDLRFTGEGWYDWNVRNWGTKWDTNSPDRTVQSPTSVHYTFDTAWSIPLPAFEAMVAQHQKLSFSIYCEEEQGWGAEFETQVDEDGVSQLVQTREWDIPDSHADYVDLGREDSCICGYEEDQDEWYDDCPDKLVDKLAKVEDAE